MPRSITFVDDEQARRGLERGMNALADSMKITLGPHNGDLRPNTLGRELSLDDPHELAGAELVKQLVQRTYDDIGDGTTTAVVLLQALVREGLGYLAAGADPRTLTAGIEAAVRRVVEQLARAAVEPTGTAQIATIAARSAAETAIGQLIAAAMERVGADGVITVEASDNAGLELELVDGMRVEGGYLSAYFVTDPEHMATVLENPAILIVDGRISAVADLLPVLETVLAQAIPLVIFAEAVEGEALSTLIVNTVLGRLPCVALAAPETAPHRAATFSDIATLTGGQVVEGACGGELRSAGSEVLGRARRVIVTQGATVVVEGAGDREHIQARITQLRAQIDSSQTTDEREQLQARLTKIVNGVAVVKVGTASQDRCGERVQRIEGAVRTATAAVEEGLVAGGGVALLRAAAMAGEGLALNGDEAIGAHIVELALVVPLRHLAANAGLSAPTVVDKVRALPAGHGLNAVTGDYVDMFQAGIIDPAAVTRCALQNAAATAAQFLCTDAVRNSVRTSHVPTSEAATEPAHRTLLLAQR